MTGRYRVYADDGHERVFASKMVAERAAGRRAMARSRGLAVYVLNDMTGYWSVFNTAGRRIITNATKTWARAALVRQRAEQRRRA